MSDSQCIDAYSLVDDLLLVVPFILGIIAFRFFSTIMTPSVGQSSCAASCAESSKVAVKFVMDDDDVSTTQGSDSESEADVFVEQ